MASQRNSDTPNRRARTRYGQAVHKAQLNAVALLMVADREPGPLFSQPLSPRQKPDQKRVELLRRLGFSSAPQAFSRRFCM